MFPFVEDPHNDDIVSLIEYCILFGRVKSCRCHMADLLQVTSGCPQDAKEHFNIRKDTFVKTVESSSVSSS